MAKPQYDDNPIVINDLPLKFSGVAASELAQMGAEILRDEFTAAKKVYAKIKDGSITNSELKEYTNTWRRLETLRMSIGEPFERQKLWQLNVPDFAADKGEDGLDSLDDRALIREGQNIAHDCESILKGARHLLNARDREYSAAVKKEKAKFKKSKPLRAKKPLKEYDPAEHPDE